MEEELSREVQVTERMSLESQLQGGASWFIWIAGLSVVTSILWYFESGIGFMFGLGITQGIDAIASEASEDLSTPMIKYIAFALDVVIAGMFAVLGVFAKKKHQWAFIVGMVLYALDGLIFLNLFKVYLSFAFHLFALFCIFKGFKACRQLNQMSGNQVAQVLTAQTYMPVEPAEQTDDNIYSQ